MDLLPLPPDLNPDSEWPEGAEEEEDEEEEGEEDSQFDAEAEEIARRLSDQLMADIAKAQLEAGFITIPQPSAPASAPVASGTNHPQSTGVLPPKAKRQDAALATMKAIMAFAAKDAQVRATLTTSIVTHGASTNIYEILNQSISAGRISKILAKPLSDALVSLAKSETLFASLRNSDAAAIQLDKGKRKRDQIDDGSTADSPQAKRPAIDSPNILHQITEAARIVSTTFASRPQTSQPPDSALVSSIHRQLHQIFLFAVTSTPRARPELQAALQELAGLIQMLGIITSIPIGTETIPTASHHLYSSDSSPPTDIGAAVYPCLVGPCTKVFHRLYSLRTHQRLHTLSDRPYRCTVCPASFLRNHDLKRHLKLHERKAWKCCGCDKIFSRRDAIKRHKDSRGRGASGGKTREGDPNAHTEPSACATAAIVEVEVDRVEGDEEATRRAKLWSGIVANQLAESANAAAKDHHHAGEDGSEEGEVSLEVVSQAQDVVLRLHPLLHSHVAGALGGISPPHAAAAFVPPPHGIAAQPGLPHLSLHPPQPQLPAPMASLQGAPSRPVQTLTAHASASAPASLPPADTAAASAGLSWLTEDQARLLEQAISQAASAAQAQAEAEAALEEAEEDEEGDDAEDEELLGSS